MVLILKSINIINASIVRDTTLKRNSYQVGDSIQYTKGNNWPEDSHDSNTIGGASVNGNSYQYNKLTKHRHKYNTNIIRNTTLNGSSYQVGNNTQHSEGNNNWLESN